MRLSSFVLATSVVTLAAAACSSDPDPNPPATPVTSTTGAGGTTTTSGDATTSTGGSAQGGSGGIGGAGGSGGMGGSGGAPMCPPILVGDDVSVECTFAVGGTYPESGSSECPADFTQFWPVAIYAVDVAAGDCLAMQADNAGSTGADLFGAIVDPSGSSLIFDEEVQCTVANPDDYQCPGGAVTIEATGTAYIMVGAFDGNGCTPGDIVPHQLLASINGTDVDLAGTYVCEGDLQTIIP